MDASREIYWQRKLRPIRLRAEPIRDQLSRQWTVTLVMSAILALIGLMIAAIFATFGRLDIGLYFFGLGFLPVIAWKWLEYELLRRRVGAYHRERELSPVNETRRTETESSARRGRLPF